MTVQQPMKPCCGIKTDHSTPKNLASFSFDECKVFRRAICVTGSVLAYYKTCAPPKFGFVLQNHVVLKRPCCAWVANYFFSRPPALSLPAVSDVEPSGVEGPRPPPRLEGHAPAWPHARRPSNPLCQTTNNRADPTTNARPCPAELSL